MCNVSITIAYMSASPLATSHCEEKTSNSRLKTRGAAAPALELLGVFVRFRRTFPEGITFGGASAHEF